VKPGRADTAATARTLYVEFNDYPERWEEIASIFSHDAVLKGLFDKYAESAKGKKGTTEVDDAFLKEIETWRDTLARSIALRNTELTQRQLNFAVQRTIDRMIFLRICEDRGIETYGALMALLNGEHVYKRLCELFHRADEKYNSGLFHFRKEKDRLEEPDELTLGLSIDDKPLKEIIRNLYYPDSPYEFSVLPADILGQVYEQFLGKVIRLTAGHRAVVEDKPEVKKAGGVYYTPTYIVDYIVKNTVGALLNPQGRHPELVSGSQERMPKPLNDPERSSGQGRHDKPHLTPKDVSKLRILDPACGSGSFLIGAYQYLLDWHRDWYVNDDPKKWATGRSPVLYQVTGGDWRLTTAERKRILLNNIYGVDIDPQAVEVTKLSLLLKVLEGENEQTISRQLKMFHEQALPDLGNNIKCGNSLIGPDFYEGKQLSLMGDEERLRINVFDWKKEFPFLTPTVLRTSPPSQGGDREGVGFDAVIGNPPYVRSINLKEADSTAWRFYHETYNSALHREWDIYLVFVEKGVSLLNPRGLLGYILPNKFLNSKVGENLRAILSREKRLQSLVHFGAYQIFENVTTYTCLLFLSGSSISEVQTARYKGPVNSTGMRCPMPEEDQAFWTISRIRAQEITRGPWDFSLSESNVLKRFQELPKLSEFFEIYQGTGTRADDVFILQSLGLKKELHKVRSFEMGEEYELENHLLKRVLRGRDIKRYRVTQSNLLLVIPYRRYGTNYELIPAETMEKVAPLTLRYFQDCKSRLNEREKGRFKGSRWYCYGRPQNMTRFEVGEKLVFPDVGNRGSFSLDSEGRWLVDTAYALVKRSDTRMELRFLLGILNSSLLTYFLRQTGTALRGGYFRMKTAYLNPFPLRSITFSDLPDKSRHDRMVEMVEEMLTLHKQLASAKTAHEKTALQRQIDATDKQIDQLVYELYGLTEEEIRIVEGTL
jgi:type I restriction-modification system DNA methylase subunit